MNIRALAAMLSIVTGLTLALTSCGLPAAKSSAATGSGCGASGPGMCVTLEAVGSDAVKGTIFVPRPGKDPSASCAAWAEGEGGNPGLITLPRAFDQMVGGRKVRFGSTIVGYAGPGTYKGGDAIRSGNDSGVGLTVSGRRYSATRALLVGQTAEVRADGSGSVTFVNLVQSPRPKKNPGQINGRYTWTCQD